MDFPLCVEDTIFFICNGLYLDTGLFHHRRRLLVELKDYGVQLKSDSKEDVVLVVAQERLAEMLRKHKGRVEDILERELARLTRVAGLQIEDERAKTNFMCAAGYLLRVDLEREKLKSVLPDARTYNLKDVKGVLTKTMSRIEHYNRLLAEIKADHVFGSVVKDFAEIGRNFAIGAGASFAISINNKNYQGIGLNSDKDTLRVIINDMIDNYEHITLSILGKVISGK